jgi:DNA-binding NarL/FixJ family response regulator
MKSSQAFLKLTQRQKDIGAFLLKGMPPKTIAYQMGISLNTVREHQQSLKRKLGCHNAYQIGYQLAMMFEVDLKKVLEVFASNHALDNA